MNIDWGIVIIVIVFIIFAIGFGIWVNKALKQWKERSFNNIGGEE